MAKIRIKTAGVKLKSTDFADVLSFFWLVVIYLLFKEEDFELEVERNGTELPRPRKIQRLKRGVQFLVPRL